MDILSYILAKNGNGGGSGGVIPDLAQNDPTAKDYVKNRTHRKYIGEVDLVPAQSVEIRDATAWYSGQTDSPIWIDPLSLENGRTYKVLFDGVIYDVKAVVAVGDGIAIAYIGNYSLVDSTAADTGEPFVYIVMSEGNIDGGFPVMLVSPEARGKTVTFRLFEEAEVYEPFDGRYLPNGLGYIISEGSQTATNTLTWDGDMSGKETVDISGDGSAYFVKMSDSTCTVDDLIGGTVTLAATNGESDTIEITSEDVEDVSSEGLPCIQVVGQFCWIMLEDFSGEGLTFTKGIWFLNVAADGYYTSALTALTDCFVAGTAAEVKKIDNRLLDLEWIPTKTVKETVIWDNVSLDLAYNSRLEPPVAEAIFGSGDEKYFELVVDQTYSVIWGGTKYENLKAVDGNGFIAIGDISGSGTYPFAIFTIPNAAVSVAAYADSDITVAVSIVKVDIAYNKLPDGYLPDSLTGVETVTVTALTSDNMNNGSGIYGSCSSARIALDGGKIVKYGDGYVLFADTDVDMYGYAIWVDTDGLNYSYGTNASFAKMRAAMRLNLNFTDLGLPVITLDGEEVSVTTSPSSTFFAYFYRLISIAGLVSGVCQVQNGDSVLDVSFIANTVTLTSVVYSPCQLSSIVVIDGVSSLLTITLTFNGAGQCVITGACKTIATASTIAALEARIAALEGASATETTE